MNGAYNMPLDIRIDAGVVILSNFARLMNDPRYIDAANDVRDLLDRGYESFVLDLGGVREVGSSFLGLLMTLTRRIQQSGGDAVLAHLGHETEEILATMQMDDYWDVFKSVPEAIESCRRSRNGSQPEDR